MSYKKKSGLIFCIVFVMFSILIMSNIISAKVSLNFANKSKGEISLSLNEGELVPASSALIIKNYGNILNYTLKNLINKNPVKGNFYAEGGSLSGNGVGFGLEGSKTSYPVVFFKLRLVDAGVNNSNFLGSNIKTQINSSNVNGSAGASQYQNQKNITNETLINNTNTHSSIGVSVNNTSINNSTKKNSTIEVSNNSSRIISKLGNNESFQNTTLTQSSNASKIQTSLGNNSGNSALIVSKNNSNSATNNLNVIKEKLIKENQNTTNSSSSPITGNVVGVGKIKAISFNFFKRILKFFQSFSFMGFAVSNSNIDESASVNNPFVYTINKGKTLQIVPGSVRTDSGNLSDDEINLEIHNNTATITTKYYNIKKGFGINFLGNKTTSFVINLSGLEINKTNLDVQLVYNNEVIVSLNPLSTIPLEINYLNLTKQERKILLDKFGNVSVQTIQAKKTENKLIIKYKLGDYWFESSYDYDTSKQKLESEMGEDRIRWLKDIASSLNQTKQIVSANDFIKNYII